MRVVLVLHQVLGVIEREFRPKARALGLSPQDLLVLGWLVEQPGISVSLLADRIRRHRANVQRSLLRFERDGLAERWGRSIGNKTAGWAPTPEGLSRWADLRDHYQAIEDRWLGPHPGGLLHALEGFMRSLVQAHRDVRISGLIDLPPRPSIPSWDL